MRHVATFRRRGGLCSHPYLPTGPPTDIALSLKSRLHGITLLKFFSAGSTIAQRIIGIRLGTNQSVAAWDFAGGCELGYR